MAGILGQRVLLVMDRNILLTVEFSVTLRKVVLSAVAVLSCSVPWYPSFKPQGEFVGVAPFGAVVPSGRSGLLRSLDI